MQRLGVAWRAWRRARFGNTRRRPVSGEARRPPTPPIGRRRVPLETQERISQLHAEDPQRWTVQALSAEFRYEPARIEAVLELAAIEARVREEVGEEVWQKEVLPLAEEWKKLERKMMEATAAAATAPSRSRRRQAPSWREEVARQAAEALAAERTRTSWRDMKPRFAEYVVADDETPEEAEQRAVSQMLGGREEVRTHARVEGSEQQQQEEEEDELFEQGDALPWWCTDTAAASLPGPPPPRMPFLFVERPSESVPQHQRRAQSTMVVRDTDGTLRAPTVEERHKALSIFGYGRRTDAGGASYRVRRIPLEFRKRPINTSSE
ncbi:hypothetical protein CDCA_CDCA11G3284 [Cyanidium caldarium]|uniref:Uncharacterized protein n=1 Tax=Cyanidium caldarium TaxID=2771 RepID=A0AAV9IYU4_CYACA|nr:hypothetical protein CDCA_CDCA11G3284 [Cyanidium caldarium]